MYEDELIEPPCTTYSANRVRQAQAEMRRLEKENFNLKLKIYYLDQGGKEKPSKLPHVLERYASDGCFREYTDFAAENDKLRADIEDKTKTLALTDLCIKELERKHCEAKLDHVAEVNWLHQRKKMLKNQIYHYKKVKGRCPVLSPKDRRVILKLRAQYTFLLRKIKEKSQRSAHVPEELIIKYQNSKESLRENDVRCHVLDMCKN
jgi:centrosomin